MSIKAAQAALAAENQDQYIGMHQALMQATNPMQWKSLMTAASSLNLNIKELKADMASATIASKIADNTTLSQLLLLQQMPSVFLTRTTAQNQQSELHYLSGHISSDSIALVLKLLKMPTNN